MVNVEGNDNLNVYKPLAPLAIKFVCDDEWSEELTRIRRQLSRRQCPEGWTEREMDEFLYKVTIAKCQVSNNRTSSSSNLF